MVKVRSLGRPCGSVSPQLSSAQLKMELNIFCVCSRQQQQQPPPSSSFWVLWFTWRLDNCPADTRISVTWAGLCWLPPSHPALKRNTKSPAAAPCPCPSPCGELYLKSKVGTKICKSEKLWHISAPPGSGKWVEHASSARKMKNSIKCRYIIKKKKICQPFCTCSKPKTFTF